MRLQQGSGTNRSYLVDPVFAKRQDAKIAVCLEAISLGVSQWIRSISTSMEDRLTKEMKDRAREVFIPAINSSLQRLKPPQRAEWIFSSQNHGVSMVHPVPRRIGPLTEYPSVRLCACCLVGQQYFTQVHCGDRVWKPRRRETRSRYSRGRRGCPGIHPFSRRRSSR